MSRLLRMRGLHFLRSFLYFTERADRCVTRLQYKLRSLCDVKHPKLQRRCIIAILATIVFGAEPPGA